MGIRIKRRSLKYAIFLPSALALLLLGLMAALCPEERNPSAEPSEREPENTEEGQALIYYEGAWYAPLTDVETILFLGLDRSDTEGIAESGTYAQSDFVLLLEIDRGAGVVRPIQLNRDTMVRIQDFDQYGRPDGTYTGQLALAYAHAQAYTGNERLACQSAVDSVSDLLYGVEIDHFVTLTMDGVILLNDLAGGVTVEVLDDFSAVDPTLVQGETVTLLGGHALNYVRSRQWVGDGSNLERMERQRQYLGALREQVADMAARDENFILQALLAVSDCMYSDCTAEQLARLAETVSLLPAEDILCPEGELTKGEQYMEFYADEDALRKMVIDHFYEREEEQ